MNLHYLNMTLTTQGVPGTHSLKYVRRKLWDWLLHTT